MRKLPSSMRELCLGAAMAILAAAAFAQAPPPEEIIVTGHYGRVPDNVQSLSTPVSYADLDISTPRGWAILQHRVRLTARYLCDKLGETDTSTSIVPSCRDAAVKDAMNRVLTVHEHSAPRGTTWVAPRPWAPPYPPDWMTRDP